MAISKAEAEWKGNLREGDGRVKVGSGALEASYSFKSRFEGGPGTTPEELIGAAHAGCFSMALSAALTKAGTPPARIHTSAQVFLEPVEGGFGITHIDLVTEAEVPGLDDAAFQQAAAGAKAGCPVSKALAGTTINLTATLK